MSSKAWPAGTLRTALVQAHAKYQLASAPQLARIVGCDPGSARVVLKSAGIEVRRARPQRVAWTEAMRARVIEAARSRVPVQLLAEELGVAPSTLASGALEIIRERIAA